PALSGVRGMRGFARNDKSARGRGARGEVARKIGACRAKNHRRAVPLGQTVRNPPGGSMTAVELEGVVKTFGEHRAVDDLNLAVPENSIYGFIGPNGSGKTTTLRMIMRILHPDVGTVRVLGDDSPDAASDRVGYLPEERGLYKQMKVRDVLR